MLFRSSLQRTLLSALYRPFPVWIEYLDRDDRVQFRYRFIPQAGLEMLIWPLVTTNDAFAKLVHGYPSRPGKADMAGRKQPVAIRFVTTSLGAPFSHTRYRLERDSTPPWSQPHATGDQGARRGVAKKRDA